jgi:hypothetical protein
MSKVMLADVRFLRPEEGGRLEPARDGVRPQLKIGEIFTSCLIRSTDGAAIFDDDESHLVAITIIFWEEYKSSFDELSPVELFEGSRRIGIGEFISWA